MKKIEEFEQGDKAEYIHDYLTWEHRERVDYRCHRIDTDIAEAMLLVRTGSTRFINKGFLCLTPGKVFLYLHDFQFWIYLVNEL